VRASDALPAPLASRADDGRKGETKSRRLLRNTMTLHGRAALLGLLIAPIACTQETSSTPGANTQRQVETAAGLSCWQMVECLGECSKDDEACFDECPERGPSDAKDQLVALFTCVDKESCATAECIDEKCATEVSGCVAGSAPKRPEPSPTPPPSTGHVPPELVGTWSFTNRGRSRILTLDAGGTGTYEDRGGTGYACVSTAGIVERGTVVVASNTISLYANDIHDWGKDCRTGAEIRNEAPAGLESWGYALTAEGLRLIDAKCANEYSAHGSEIIAWHCAFTMHKD
jgi:hypothetical protein